MKKLYLVDNPNAGFWPADEEFSLSYLTGKQVTIPRNTAVVQDVDVLDEEGNPTGEVQQVFVRWEIALETVDELAGGFTMLAPTWSNGSLVAVYELDTTVEKHNQLIEWGNVIWLADVEEPELEVV